MSATRTNRLAPDQDDEPTTVITDGPAGDEDAADSSASEPHRPTSRRARWIVLLVLLALLLGLVASGLLYLSDRSREASRAEALDAARSAAVALTSMNFDSADADVQRVIDAGTGEFGDLFRQNLDSYIGMVRESKVDSTGEVTGAALIESGSSTAEALVAVRSMVDNSSSPEAEPRLYRMRLEMMKEDDRWLVNKLDFVG
ncbi:hypothetical protein [Pseudonocardia xishanensis]|uniref:Mce-associated membrane protein n=1 Tax=Pseudonocardia xishanensis TaxID=630995 RepID=A0ABP8RU63_9PSEU